MTPRSNWRAHSLAAALLLFLWLGGLGVGCGGDDRPDATTAKAEIARIERLVVATGTVEPEHEVEIRPRIAGIIEKILVKAGDSVVVGQPLVEIERNLLQSQVKEAEAALTEARVGQRYAAIEQKRVERLRKQGAASPQQTDDARSAAESSGARVARAEAQLETLSTQLGYASVVASLDGRVLHIPSEEGSAVSPVTAVTGGTLLMSIAATDILFLKGLVDENQVSHVQIGQVARVRTEAFSGRIFEGEVREIAPLGERIQNVTYFEVKIAIDQGADAVLKPRMSGDADILVETVEDALTIPETSLRYRGDQIYVEARAAESGDDFEPRDITIGIVDGSRVQVLSGLEKGDEVTLQ